jgi:hypothetical protein
MSADLLAGLRASLAPHNGHARDPGVVAKRFGLGKRGLTPRQWKALNEAIARWRDRLLAGTRHLPHQAYRQGHEQTTRFLRLLGTHEPAVVAAPDRATSEWLQWLLEHELTGTLDRYTDEIRSAVLYGLEGETNPVNVAAALYKATEAADRDWRLVAQTEMARANALGRLDGSIAMGYDEVWIPPHVGACDACKRLIENKVFPAALLKANVSANYGKKQRDWVPALPLHPRCTHGAVPKVPEVYHEAQQEYQRMQDVGLTDEAIGEMFDSSGQLRPQFKDDPRLHEMGKSMSPAMSLKSGSDSGMRIVSPEFVSQGMGVYEAVLTRVIAKVRSGGHISKGFFDPPQAGLDPLIWQNDEELRPEVRAAILAFWTGVLGEGWEDWARVFVTGSAASYSWGTGWHHPWLGSHQTQVYPDIDTHLVLDYDKVRAARPLWAGMSPMELRKLLESWTKKAKVDIEVAPGLRLDAFIRTEWSKGEFEADISHTGQGVYDVNGDRWLQQPTEIHGGETYGRRLLAGTGGRLAEEHPDWVSGADDVSAELQRRLDAYTATPAPETLQALQSYMDALYEARTAGFLEGAGQEDRANFTWQLLEVFGPLLDAKAVLAANPS